VTIFYCPRFQTSFSLPPTTRRVTVEVFVPRLHTGNWLFSTELFFITTSHGLNRKHSYQQYRYCVFTDPLPRNGFFDCCMIVHSRGNLFTELLLSNELFRLLGIISQYCFLISLFIIMTRGKSGKVACFQALSGNHIQLRATDWMAGVWFSAGSRGGFRFHNLLTGSEVHLASYPVDTGGLCDRTPWLRD
jgi:hypothetical protein